MTDFAIHVTHLGKQYRIGASPDRYNTLRDSIVGALKSPIRRIRQGILPGTSDERHTIWALKDVSFDVQQGQVLGVIGRNGAGKSTLLKILSRVTEPSAGEVQIRGRVGSLLEVGTGFHPELTGRENTYLNGAILGMPRIEIDRKFDEIVDFSGVEKFIDTPVKRYSSGMYLRLAFAVAAHLEPEILVVDEVLAVGDAEFQRKCLGKMSDVAQEGRTVLFVSHNMSAILRLTEEAIVLDRGKLVKRAPAIEAVDYYMSSGFSEAGDRNWTADEWPQGPFKPLALRVRDPRGQIVDMVRPAKPVFKSITQVDNQTVRLVVTLPSTDAGGANLTGLTSLAVATGDGMDGLTMEEILALGGFNQEIPLTMGDAGTDKTVDVPVLTLGVEQKFAAACAD